jgi:serine phosphatase RsbU (regulator of sigma subunit)
LTLRRQLIIVFLLLAVLPLTGIVFYTYWTSERALREAAAAEGRALAADMEERMERATLDLEDRLRRAGNLPFQPAAASGPEEREDLRRRLLEHLRAELGDAAELVESVAFSSEPPRPPAPPGGSPPPPGPPPPVAPLPEGEVVIVPEAAGGEEAERSRPQLVWRHLLEGELTEEEQGQVAGEMARHATEVGRHILSEVQRQIEEAPDPSRKAEELGRQAVVAARRAFSAMGEWAEGARDLGSVIRELDFTVEYGGERFGTLRARVRGEELLEEILANTRRDRGEIPFAVDAGGSVHAPDPADREQIEALGAADLLGGGEGSVRTDEDWIVVTRHDAESGLTLGIARPIGRSLGELRNTAARNLSYGLSIALLAFVGIVLASRRMTRDLEQLTEGAEALAQGNLDTRVQARSRDEIGRLSSAFNRMAESLREQQSALVERERLRKELEMSRLIQEELLPREPLRLSFAEVSGLSLPAREVGGDFFNYFSLPDGALAVLVGDVSGKGVPAALLAANLQATLRARLPVERDLGSLARSLDAQVDENTPSYVYVTLFMAVLDPGRRSLCWLNAGHNPQYLLRSRGGFEALDPGGRPLGLLPGGDFIQVETDLADGDALFLYTDGLTDSENAEGDYFGQARLEDTLRGDPGEAPEQMLARIESAVRAFRGRVEAGDDATLVVLKHRVAPGA